MIKKELLDLLIQNIKSKKQINQLEDNYIKEKIEKYLLTEGNIKKRLEKEYLEKKEKINKNKIFKKIVKSIREEIGIIYGSFLTQDFKKKEKILEKIKTIPENKNNQFENKEKIEELLKLHKSTRERIKYYKEIYFKIFEWYLPKKIADLACGLNPISYIYIREELKYEPFYFASDLNSNDMKFLNSYFEKFKINGIAKAYDIVNLNILKDENFIKTDLVFLFKAIDSFEKIKKNISKTLLEKIPAKHIVVSFPTKSIISKKDFKIEKRNWLINFIKKKEWNYKQFEVENELFFLIKKD